MKTVPLMTTDEEAEAFLNQICGDQFEAHSAGIEPGKLNPIVVEAMQEIGIDLSGNQTKAVFDLYRAATARARYPDGSGDWKVPSQFTPGAGNVVALHNEIVINEIMYHPPPFDPVPAVTSNFTLVPITGAWRYDDTGADLGSAWRAPGFNDGAWASGAGLLAFNAGALVVFPVLPNATKYSMSALKWMLHTCHFCVALKSSTIEEAVEFFQGRIEAEATLSELLSLRRHYRPSFRFVKGCFGTIVRLYSVTVKEAVFPISIERLIPRPRFR